MKLVSVGRTPFCVYAHLIDGLVFYIGIGDLGRAFSRGARNSLWKNKVGDGDFTIEIVSYHTTKEEAKRAEAKFIKDLSPECNVQLSGRPFFSEETRALWSAQRTGRRHSSEAKAKMSASQRGHGVSEQTRAKMRENMNRSRAAGQFDMIKRTITCLDTGETYSSIADAARHIGISTNAIVNHLKRRTKTCNGWRFAYADRE